MNSVLSGLRVVELGGGTSAPFCARLLADYGAEVIKAEAPEGDEARRQGPFAGDDPGPEKSIPFLYLNTNKRGVTLDTQTPTGRSVLARLARWADVVVENFAPADKARFGVDYAGLSALNPALIVTSITPFGLTGPYRDYQATDLICFALSGHLYHSGDSDKAPLRNALSQSYYVAGANGAVATLAAVFRRLTTGQGQQADVSVVECLASHLAQPAPYYTYLGAIKGRRPVRGSGFEELMPARDGYVVPSVQGSQPWAAVAELLGEPELQDPRFASGAGRIEHGEELKELVIKALAKWDRKPLFQESGERRLVFGMAQDAGDLLECPHLAARQFYVEAEHPIVGRYPCPGAGAQFSEAGYQLRRPAPLLGQHNAEVYCDLLGYSREELVKLRETGVI